MSGSVDLLEVEFFGKVAEEHLGKECSVQIQKLVGFPIRIQIGLLGKIFCVRHAGGLVEGSRREVFGLDSMLLELGIAIGSRRKGNDLVGMCGINGRLQNRRSGDEAHQALLENFVGRLAVGMGVRILQDLLHIFACIFQDEFRATRMIVEEVGHIEDAFADGDIA